jgi:hypothetical protein
MTANHSKDRTFAVLRDTLLSKLLLGELGVPAVAQVEART